MAATVPGRRDLGAAGLARARQREGLRRAKLPLHARAFAWATGVLAPDGKAPAYLRFVVKRRAAAAREAARRLVALDPERVIFAHGRWFDRHGAAQLRRSFGS